MSSSFDDSGCFGSEQTNPFGDTLLSPATISSLNTDTPGTSVGLMDRDNCAYIQLVCQYGIMEEELRKEKMGHNLLK